MSLFRLNPVILLAGLVRSGLCIADPEPTQQKLMDTTLR